MTPNPRLRRQRHGRSRVLLGLASSSIDLDRRSVGAGSPRGSRSRQDAKRVARLGSVLRFGGDSSRQTPDLQTSQSVLTLGAEQPALIRIETEVSGKSG
jgi:hypothetical protein